MEYREKFLTHNKEFNTSGITDFKAVLDGQQRLASLYIGMKGSYAYKKEKVHWINSEDNIPTRHLYLNIIAPLREEEDGRNYEFKFLTEKEHSEAPDKWFRVGLILDLKNSYDFNKFLDRNKYKDNNFTYSTLSRLQEMIHTDRSINYFLEKDQSLDKALNIFIRINSGGEPLDFSDLLMSIAIASWRTKDAKAVIFKLVDEIRDKGFFISKDFILKTFLSLYSNDIKFRVSNFSSDNAKEFEKKWDGIRAAIVSSFDLVKTFGFIESTLTSKNALIPIIYYLYHKSIYKDFHKKVGHKEDRDIIKKWLHIVLLKKIFGGQPDTLLNNIRSVFTNKFPNTKILPNITTFPIDDIALKLKATNKNMHFDDEYIDYLLLTQKDDGYAFSVLALIYPNLDYKNNDFDKDHLHPAAIFNKKSLLSAGIDVKELEFYMKPDNYNSILNLQMLDANDNKSKQDKSLKDWVSLEAKERKLTLDEFCTKHLIPPVLDIADFPKFIEQRKTLLRKLLSHLIERCIK